MAHIASTIAEVLRAELNIDANQVATVVERVLQSSVHLHPSSSSEVPQVTSSKASGRPHQCSETNGRPPSPTEPKAKSWSQLFKLEEQSKALQFHEPALINGQKIVKPPKEIFEEGALRWRNALVGQIIGKSFSLNRISSVVNFLWGRNGPIHVLDLGNGLLLFDLPSDEVKNWVLRNGPWHIHHSPLILRPWERDIKPLDLKQNSQPVWVTLKNLPLELMTPNGISYVASGLGTPICLDKATESFRKLGTARICVEIQMEADLKNTVPVMLEDGSILDVIVEYPMKTQPKPPVKKWIAKPISGANTSNLSSSTDEPHPVVEPISGPKTDSGVVPSSETCPLVNLEPSPSRSNDGVTLSPGTTQQNIQTNNMFAALADPSAGKSVGPSSPKKARAAAKGVSLLLQNIKQHKNEKGSGSVVENAKVPSSSSRA